MNKEQFDNKIDQLARKAVEQPILPYSEEAWDKMEQLLDKKDKRRRFIILWWLFPILFFIGTTIYFWNKSNHISKQYTSNTSTTGQDKKPVSTTTQQTNEQLAIKEKTNTENPIDAQEGKVQQQATVTSRLPEDATATTQALPVEQGTSAAHTSLSDHLTRSKKQDAHFNISQAKVAAQTQNKNALQPVAATVIENKNTLAAAQNDVQTVYTQHAMEKLVPIASHMAFNQKKVGLKEQLIDTKKPTAAPKEKKKRTVSRFGIGALVAADISTVKFTKVDKISNAVGIGFSYDLSNKFSLATGFAVSTKLYSADSNTYKSPWSLGSRYLIKGISANCFVFDIPLNLQYKLKENKRSGWFAIAGLSTYIMKRETYDYDYDYYGQDQKVKYEVSNQNNHLFSILNLSAAYRRGFNKNFAWQIAPFAKIPLTGIGNGKVGLYSLGLEFSVLFKPNKKQ